MATAIMCLWLCVKQGRSYGVSMSRMTEVIKIMYAKDGRCHEVSASRTTEPRKIMCVNDG
jgi:hypothetical protein